MNIVYRVSMFVWVFKADWFHFWSMSSNFILRRRCVVCISFFVEVLGLWSVFFIVLNFSSWTMILWKDKFLFLHHIALAIISRLFIESTSNTVFFQIWNRLGPCYFIGSGLILLTSVFVDVLTLIWSILMVKCVAKITVNNGLNHGMGFCHVYICFL